MGCPHSTSGSPDWCSQCRAVIPRIVLRDDATGALTLDGKVVERKFMLPTSGAHTVRRTGRPKKAAPPAILDVADLELPDD